ncbi:MAG: hypothetical protein B0W54_06635 [Cellvibrio sp. 79]|nr:MAG: hypothetical protein B0W54_06635 [Cellvibrio sp. 79]
MIPAVKNNQYSIAFDPKSDIAYLLFETIYQGETETPIIQLPRELWNCYVKYGDKEFSAWVKRIDEDYQVGRFSRENPRIYTDYQLASTEEINAIKQCFDGNVTLIEKEALRLLSLYDDRGIVSHCVAEMLKQGRLISIELFCLTFFFYENEEPLVDNQGNILIAKANTREAQRRLNDNSLMGCPDAALIALGFLASGANLRRIFFRFSILSGLEKEFNFRYLRERVYYYIDYASKINPDEGDGSNLELLVQQFKKEFPSSHQFELTKDNVYIPHWMFMEQTLAWEYDCIDYMEQCFIEFDMQLDRRDLLNLLYLPSERDWHWNSYSLGQAIKYCNQDPEYFTKDTVRKPKMPIAGYENFVVSVWLHYIRFFKPNLHVTRENINSVLNRFVSGWNGD